MLTPYRYVVPSGRTPSPAWLFMIAVLVVLRGGPAIAEDLELSYQAPADCPREAALRDAVAKQLGRDPFSVGAPYQVSCTIAALGKGFGATITVAGSPALKTISSPGASCAEIVEAAAVALTVAIDPIVTAEPSPPAAPFRSRAPAAPPRRVSFGATVEGLVSAGATIAPAAVGGLGLVVARERWSGWLIARSSSEVNASFAGGVISTAVRTLRLLGCASVNFVHVCGSSAAAVCKRRVSVTWKRSASRSRSWASARASPLTGTSAG